MDTRSEIREFLTSRRARITPEEAGLRTYGGNRRVRGLRREEVALLAGVSVDYYTRLERGTRRIRRGTVVRQHRVRSARQGRQLGDDPVPAARRATHPVWRLCLLR